MRHLSIESRIFALPIIFFMIICLFVPIYAEPDTEVTENTEETINTDNTEAPSEDIYDVDDCICGRPYYMADGENYKKYDCVKCKKNIYLCTCDCWCGSRTTASTENNLPVKICNNCQKKCSECTCADKATALKRENDIRTGVLSTIGISKPNNILPMLISVLIIFALIVVMIALLVTKGFSFKRSSKGNSSASIKNLKEKTGFDTGRFLLREKTAIAVYVEQLRSINTSIPSAPEFQGKNKTSLTAKDLSALLYLSDLENKNVFIQAEPKRENVTRLINCGLAKETEEAYTLSEKGKIISNMIFTPDRLTEIKNQSSSSYCYCVKDNYGIIIENNGDLYNIYLGHEINDYIKYVTEHLIYHSDNRRKINHFGSFSYEEWLVLVIALYTRKVSFTVDDVSNKDNMNYLIDNYSELYSKDESFNPENVLSQNNVVKYLQLLKEKKILTEDGGYYSFTSVGNAFNYRNIKDILYIYKNGNTVSFLVALFKKSQAGDDYITLMVDSGNQINYCITDRVEWEKFIK